jgi:hypothetical protein
VSDEIVFGLDWQGRRFSDASEGMRAFAADTEKAVEKAAPALRHELETYLRGVALAMEKRHSQPWHPGTSPPGALFRRSGALVAAIRDSVRVSGQTLDNIEGRIGASVEYAHIQEYGGTIVPTTAKYLAIPLPNALDVRGVPLKAGPREWSNTFVARSKAGNLLIFQKQSIRIVPLYVLKNKVTIPARLGLGDELRLGMGAFMDNAMSRMLAVMGRSN